MIRVFTDFQTDVLDASHHKPVLVDFWAAWCGPCRSLGPVLERLAEQANDRWELVKIDIEEHPDIAMRYQVQSIPAVKLFVQGEVAGEFLGALPQPQVEAWLATHLPQPTSRALEGATAALARGDRAKAQSLLRQAMDEDPTAALPRVMLAEQLLLTDPDQASHLLSGLTEDAAEHDRAEALATLARLVQLARTSGAGSSATAPAGTKPQAWSLYLKGASALSEQRYDDALSAWIDVLSQDRALDDDGARRACVALFRWLGEDHPATKAHRRAFSSALY